MTQSLYKHLLSLLTWLAAYFSPVLPFILLIGFFIVADTITGMIAAKYRNEAITSKKFRAIFSKYIVYGIAVLVAHVIQKQYAPEFPALKLISGLVAYSELMSIDENIKVITGLSLFKYFIKKIK